MKKLLSILTVFLPMLAVAQFAPSVGQLGTTAIHADSSIFIDWASGCTIIRGNQDISSPSLGITTVGDNSCAIGKAGQNGVVSLGDGGEAVLTFNPPIINGIGFDFAVFENSFSDLFLELAFVEVSSDGINFFRFPATSLTQDTLQIDGYGFVEATKINNLAGKYRANYGTPFDLEELINTPLLNINAITHIKIVDVVGCINSQYATKDQYGNVINDPWPTPFPSSGFDLDAVGVINQAPTNISGQPIHPKVSIFPNPTSNSLHINPLGNFMESLSVSDLLGNMIIIQNNISEIQQIDTSSLENGIYFIKFEINNQFFTQKIVIKR